MMNYQSAFREMVANIYGKDNVLVVHTSTIEFLDGNVLAAMLLEQILFYAGLKTSNGGSFYKRYKEWKDELYAPISRIRAAVSFLVDRGLIKTQVRRVKIKDKHGNWTGRFGDTAVFYQLQWEEYEKQFSDFLRNYAEKKRQNNKTLINNIGNFQTKQITHVTIEQKTTEYQTLEQKPLKTLSAPEGANEATESFAKSQQNRKDNQRPSTREVLDDMRHNQKKQPSSWNIRAAKEFAKIVASYRKVHKSSDLLKWAEIFRRMREMDKIPKKEIRETIEWYRNHIGEKYVPEAFSAYAFRRKFAEGKFTAAMKRLQ